MTKHELFFDTFVVYASKPMPILIAFNLRKIRVDLSKYWSFYGLKLPRKYLFSLFKVWRNSSNSLTILKFVTSLVTEGTREKIYNRLTFCYFEGRFEQKYHLKLWSLYDLRTYSAMDLKNI